MSGKEQQYSKSEQELRVLKERVKFFLNVRKMANEQEGNTSMPLAAMIKQFIKKTAIGGFKVMVKVLPRRLLLNPATYLIFKTVGKILDKRIQNIRDKVKSNFILFSEELPDRFDLPFFNRPVVSIIVPVHNKYFYTHKCLYSILQHTPDVSYEVIIGDDASTDETAEIRDRIGNVEVNYNATGLGFLRNCNAAAKHARGKYILLLNNDTVVQPGWLSSMVKLMEADEQTGMTGSKLVYPEGFLQEAGGIIWKDASGWNYGRLNQPDLSEYNYVKEVDYVSGASIMIRKQIWDTLGGFDDQYAPAYYEDTDIAFAIRKLGYKVVYQPQSVVVHFEGVSHGTDLNAGVKSFQNINKEKFISKWRKELNAEHFESGQNVFCARERSCAKKTILVIDHYVPEFDKDAGSKCTFQYLKLFVEMGLNVKFIGDNFLNKDPYTSVLQQLGIEVLYGYQYEKNWKNWIDTNSRHLHYVFLNRPHITEKYIDFIKEHTAAKVIYFGHDLHFLREQRQYEIEHKKSLLKSAKMWKEEETKIFYKSDLVLYPSDVEIEEIKKIDKGINAEVMQLNVFDNDTGSNAKSFDPAKKDLLFVGGFNHPPNVDAVLWFAKEVFPGIVSADSSIRFIVVGSKVPEQIVKLNSENIIIKGFVSDEELTRLYETCRIVVAPLRYGAGIKGKIVEAIYYRNAVVTTSIGAEGLDNSMGLITVEDDPKKQTESILKLYTDTARLERIFNDSPKFIQRFFSKETARAFIQNKIL